MVRSALSWLCNSKRLYSRRFKILLAISVLIIVPFIYFEVTFPVRYMFKNVNVSVACVIPQLDPFDPSILQFVWEPKPLVCESSLSLVYINDAGYVQFNQSALDILKKNEASIRCSYKTVQRNTDDLTVNVSSSTPFQPSPQFYIDSDFFNVECKDKDTGQLIYNKVLTSARKVDGIEPDSKEQLSVILFGLDSVSRSAAIRTLPKTFRYLTEELNSYDFKGYMKIGENTFPNIVALLTGRKIYTKELPWQSWAVNGEGGDPFDPMPLLWRNFSAKKYATLYAEDMIKFGTFNYLARGFINAPTDHYTRPYYLAMNELDTMKDAEEQVLMFLENHNLNVQTSSSLCYGNTPRHLIQMEYYKQFIRRYAGKRKFGFSFLTLLSHEYPNFLNYGDKDFTEFLKWLKHDGHLDNTVLIFFSDHGTRIDKIRNTFVGRIEDRMPLMQIVIPDHIKSKYPKLHTNLQINTNRLTTPFDIHQTLVDVLSQSFDNPTKGYVDDVLRSISLFQPVPSSRSCKDAHIPEVYCACYMSTKVEVTDPIAQALAEKIVRTLNNQLISDSQCAQLTLSSIVDVRLIANGLQHVATENTGISFLQFLKPEGEKAKRYTLSVETVPGHGVFESTLDVKSQRHIKVVGDIVRINKYGDQSKCTAIKLLRPLCFCKGIKDQS